MNRVMSIFLLIGVSAIAIACESAAPPTASSPTPSESLSPVASSPTPTTSPTDTSTSQSTAGLDSATYLLDNPDVSAQIKAGKFKSALDHYEQVGKSGKNAKGDRYESTFAGTSGNDTVRGLGAATHTHFIGVDLEVVPSKGGDYPVVFKSLGKGEVDILIGNSDGENEFILGSYITSANLKAEPFYVGKGDDDYARVQNFTKGRDAIYLAGVLDQYKLESANGTVRISTKEGDLVAIVEGVDKLKLGKISKEYGQFGLK